MISRNKSKVDTKLNEIKQKYPSIATLGIQCDFSAITSMTEYRKLSEELINLDIGVLCLNAGITNPGCIN